MKNIRKNKFGSLDYLSSPVSKKIEMLTELLEQREISYDIYYGYPIIDENDHKDYVKGFIITKRGIIILFEHEEENAVFASCLLNHLSMDSSLFKISKNYNMYVKSFNILHDKLSNLISLFDSQSILGDEDILKVNRSIQKAYNLTSDDSRTIANVDSLGYQLKERNSYIGNYDSTQFNMVHSPIKSHQRIRGLAGSGKTILMLKKLAFLHYNYPELNLAFIFYTTSLKASMIRQFESFYRDYDRYGKPDMNKVHIFHAWGGTRKGFYSDLCDRTNNIYRTYSNAKFQIDEGQDPFEYVCEELKNNLDNSVYFGTYDYIFVDEAQDFGINFYQLCIKALRKENNNNMHVETGFLVYAYDELQSLREEVKIPSKLDIFGSEVCEDINLTRSYRATVEILTTAHAIGLGIYRNVNHEHPLVNYVNEQNFIDIGYQNEHGDFYPGRPVCLYRKEKKSGVEVPKPLEFDDESEQYLEVSKMIIDLIENEDVLPSDIMIIDLDDQYLTRDHNNFSKIFYNQVKQRENNSKYNIRVKLMNSKTPDRIESSDALMFTSVYRAKGNEANLVILVNCNSIQLSSVNSLNRNKIFTAMTRAKWKVWLFGKNVDSFESEIVLVREKNYKLEFTSPTEEERKAIKFLSAKEERIDSDTEKAAKILNTLPIDVVKDLFEKQLNKR